MFFAKKIIMVSTLGLIAGCSYTQQKDGVKQAPLKSGSSISFADINEQILKPNCMGCHSGAHSPSLMNYGEVKAALIPIRNQVIEKKTMPKRGPLLDSELAMLEKWMEEGAPEIAENPSPSPSPTPPTGGERPLIKWPDLVKTVLTPRCFNCHYKGNPDKVTNLQDLSNFSGTIGTILFVTIVSPAMPPAPHGTPEGAPNPNQLTRAEKEMLSNWVIDGMLP